MKKSIFAVALLVMCAVAQAGFTSFNCTFGDDPQELNHDWTFVNTSGTDEDGSYDATLSLEEVYKAPFPNTDAVNMSAVTNSDPIVKIAKFVTNGNGHAWTGYTLTLNGPAGVSFTGAAGSDYFSTAVVTPNLITFSNGSVPVGDEVTLIFRVLVADAGNFDWCVTQQAIPEPATMSILGLGALALFRRK